MMKKRWIAFAAALMMVLGLFGAFPAFAAEETITVPVSVSGIFEGENHWADATYTCVATDGVPAGSGILSNGKYSFMYFPQTGEIKKNAQTDNGFFFNDAVVPTVVIPWKIDPFAVSGVNYPAKTIQISATAYIHPFNTLDPGVKILAHGEGTEAVAPRSLYGLPAACKDLVIKLPDSIKTIGTGAFCAATFSGAIFHEIVIPEGVTMIDKTAFGLTRFPACTFPVGVTSVSDNVLQNNSLLQEITFKGEITRLGAAAFSGCTSLRTMTFEGKNAPVSIAANSFTSVRQLTVRYPANGAGYDSETFRGAFPADTVFEPFAVKPSALGISVTGGNLVGDVLAGRYESFVSTDGSVESGSTAAWYRADDSAFTKNVELIETKPIRAGEQLTYTLTEADNNKYIRFGVTPRSSAEEGNLGDETFAQLSERVRIPQTQPIVTLLSPRDGYKVYVGNDIQLTASAICDNTTITKVEYYANGSLCGSADTAPYMVNWSGAPVGDYTITAKAYNALGETGESLAISIRVADLSERTEPVWAQKWTYDFEEFTTDEIYTNATGLTLPGEKPPAVSISTGGTVQSAKRLFDKDADDHHMQINSINGQMTPATVQFNLTDLDQPINNIVAEVDIAFSSTDETRYVFEYMTPSLPYRAFTFSNKGTIQYNSKSGTKTFKDKEGKELTYAPDTWYHLGVKFDFVNKTISYYLNGEELPMEDPEIPSHHDFISTSRIQVYGVHSASQTGIMYLDNLSLGQEQDSYVTSVMTAPLSGYSLKGTDIQFEGYAKDSTGRKIEKVEFYANEQLIAEKPGDSYSFTLPDMPCGVYDVYARAISESGEEGVSETVRVVVDGVTLPKMYSDGMLLQRNKPIRIAGTGIDGVQVTALLNGVQAAATVENGKWSLTLPAQAANKNTTLTISTSEGTVNVIRDVAIGELIMCSGQSNMAYTMGAYPSTLALEADKTYEDIRLFVQPETSAGTPQTDAPLGYWTEATPSAANRFSAVGYLTGKNYYLSQNGEVPVGLIKGSVGGTVINRWVDAAAFDFDPDLAANKVYMSNYYNGMIHPFNDYTIGTAIWYQGESNTPLNTSYEKMMGALIESWRNARQDDLNFIIVQLPIFDYLDIYKDARSAVGVREGQYKVSETYENVETVIAVDTGDARGIHPGDKLPIAERCSLVLQHFTHPEDTELVWKSPSFDHFEQSGDTMTLYFKDAADGLKIKDGAAPRGFKIAGDDGKFVDADVTLNGNTIVVDTSKVTGTPRVRYAWEDSPALDSTGLHTTLNLVNSAGLPMAPFRTDRDRYNFKTFDHDAWVLSDPVNFTPQVLSVQTDGVIRNGETTVTVRARDVDDAVAKVEVYADGSLLGEAVRVEDSDIYTYRWTNPAPGTHSLHAIATDTAGTTSVKQDPSLGSKTVTPKKYPVTLSQGGGYAIFPFEDLKGNQIDTFAGKDGVSVTADTQEGSARLMLAAYDSEDSLLTIKSAEGERVSLTAAELGAAVKVKAFLLDQEMKPLTADREILRTK